jgi:hypothetical protein
MPGQTIGVIGLGIMGSAVSANLLLERVRALETQGGRGATSVRARRGGPCHDLAAAQPRSSRPVGSRGSCIASSARRYRTTL